MLPGVNCQIAAWQFLPAWFSPAFRLNYYWSRHKWEYTACFLLSTVFVSLHYSIIHTYACLPACMKTACHPAACNFFLFYCMKPSGCILCKAPAHTTAWNCLLNICMIIILCCMKFTVHFFLFIFIALHDNLALVRSYAWFLTIFCLGSMFTLRHAHMVISTKLYLISLFIY